MQWPYVGIELRINSQKIHRYINQQMQCDKCVPVCLYALSFLLYWSTDDATTTVAVRATTVSRAATTFCVYHTARAASELFT